jgi:hypothetical protein
VKDAKNTSIRDDGECYTKELVSKGVEVDMCPKLPEKPMVMKMECE